MQIAIPLIYILQALLTVGDKGVQLKILFDRMVQKNTTTGWERRLRLAVKQSDEDKDGIVFLDLVQLSYSTYTPYASCGN